ncbi:MAG: hypothetical protein ACE5RO_05600, partial [Candidatus Nitrosomaritimum yanchengensis]
RLMNKYFHYHVILMNPMIIFRKQKLYCKYCKAMPTIDIPSNIDLASPSSAEFVENVRCTICKNVGYVRR